MNTRAQTTTTSIHHHHECHAIIWHHTCHSPVSQKKYSHHLNYHQQEELKLPSLLLLTAWMIYHITCNNTDISCITSVINIFFGSFTGKVAIIMTSVSENVGKGSAACHGKVHYAHVVCMCVFVCVCAWVCFVSTLMYFWVCALVLSPMCEHVREYTRECT